MDDNPEAIIRMVGQTLPRVEDHEMVGIADEDVLEEPGQQLPVHADPAGGLVAVLWRKEHYFCPGMRTDLNVLERQRYEEVLCRSAGF